MSPENQVLVQMYFLLRQSLFWGTFVRICFVFFLFVSGRKHMIYARLIDYFRRFFSPCSFNDLEKIQLESRGNA